jgi:hypothetical protein
MTSSQKGKKWTIEHVESSFQIVFKLKFKLNINGSKRDLYGRSSQESYKHQCLISILSKPLVHI